MTTDQRHTAKRPYPPPPDERDIIRALSWIYERDYDGPPPDRIEEAHEYLSQKHVPVEERARLIRLAQIEEDEGPDPDGPDYEAAFNDNRWLGKD